MEEYQNNKVELSSWRDTAIYPRLLFFDARCLFPIFGWLMHMCMETFYMAVAGIAFFRFWNFLKLRQW